jgi:YD repeat-containing protein
VSSSKRGVLRSSTIPEKKSPRQKHGENVYELEAVPLQEVCGSGRLTRAHRLVLGDWYETAWSYDAHDRIRQITYPSVSGRKPFVIECVYDDRGGGALKAVRDAEGATYRKAKDYDGQGRVTWDEYGNGVFTLRGFDPQTGRLQSIMTSSQAAVDAVPAGDRPKLPDRPTDVVALLKANERLSLQWLTYTYDENGNLTERAERSAGQLETFRYDFLDRLERWTATRGDKGNDVPVTYRYDAPMRWTRCGNIAWYGRRWI